MSSNLTIYKQTPSQTVGPYFAYGLCPEQYSFDLKSLFTPSIADRESAGQHISIVGQVFDGEEKVVGDAVIEMAQADSTGRYVSTLAETRESGFRGFARVGTGTDPEFHRGYGPGRVGADLHGLQVRGTGLRPHDPAPALQTWRAGGCGASGPGRHGAARRLAKGEDGRGAGLGEPDAAQGGRRRGTLHVDAAAQRDHPRSRDPSKQR